MLIQPKQADGNKQTKKKCIRALVSHKNSPICRSYQPTVIAEWAQRVKEQRGKPPGFPLYRVPHILWP